MCDVKEYRDIFNQIKKLSHKDTLQIMLESTDEEEKNFYEMVDDFLLQSKQKQVMERNLF